MNQEIVGHARVVEILKRLFCTKQMDHAYLFSGPRHVGKHTVAHALLECLPQKETICIGRNIDEDERQTESIGIGQIRDMVHSLTLSLPGQEWYRVILIDDAETITHEAGNALLKSLEEPPEHTVFIFFEHAPGRVLHTISSRCVRVRFSLAKESDIRSLIGEKISSQSARDAVVQFAAGRPGMAHALLSEDILTQLKAHIARMRSYSETESFSKEHAEMTFQREDEQIAELALHRQIQSAQGDMAIYREALARYDTLAVIRVWSAAHVAQPGLMEAFL